MDLSKLAKTKHYSVLDLPLYIYQDNGDGTGILTDGKAFYLSWDNFKQVGDECPPGARFLKREEELLLTKMSKPLQLGAAAIEQNEAISDDDLWSEMQK